MAARCRFGHLVLELRNGCWYALEDEIAIEGPCNTLRGLLKKLNYFGPWLIGGTESIKEGIVLTKKE